MARWLRPAILAVAVVASLVVLAAAVAVFLVLPRPEFQQWLGGRLSKAVGPGVDFASVSLAFWPAPGVRLHEVTLGEAAGTEGNGIAKLGSVRCTLLLRPLLEGDFVLDRLAIEEPVLSVERDADGRWLFGTALSQILARAAGSGRAGPAAGSEPAPRPRLFLRDGTVDLQDRRVAGGPVTLPIRNLDVDLELPGSGNPGRLAISMDGPPPAHLEVDARIGPTAPGRSLADVAFEADLRGRSLGSDSALLYLLFGLPIRNPGGVFDIDGSVSGRISDAVEGRATIDVPTGFVDGWGIRLATPVRLSASFDVSDGKFSMHGARLEASGAAFSGYAAEKAEALFHWAAGDLRVEVLDLDAYGGAWRAQGSVSFVDPPAFSLEIHVDRVAFRELATAVAGDEVEEGFETLSGEANLQGRWTGPDAWQGTLKGSGRVHLTGGQLQSSPVVRTLVKEVFARIPGTSNGAAGRPSGELTMLERLDASFALRDGRAFTEDLDLATSAYRMQGKGSLGLDGTLQLSTRVALTSRSVAEMYRLTSVGFKKRGENSLPAIPVQVYGTIDRPQIVPDVTALPLAPFRALFGGARGAVGLLRGAAAPEEQPLEKEFDRESGSGDEEGAEAGEGQPSGADEPPDAVPP